MNLNRETSNAVGPVRGVDENRQGRIDRRNRSELRLHDHNESSREYGTSGFQYPHRHSFRLFRQSPCGSILAGLGLGGFFDSCLRGTSKEDGNVKMSPHTLHPIRLICSDWRSTKNLLDRQLGQVTVNLRVRDLFWNSSVMEVSSFMRVTVLS